VLGICLGMQLMCKHSEEGDTACLGIFDQRVKKFNTSLKVPQIGWNRIRNLKSGLFKEVNEGEYLYFVHSYYAELGVNTVAETDYDLVYSSSLQRDNFYATQFHPEKSSDTGKRILENFIKL
ncbi:MAG TPA: imidazole glycerol phosphate synthase subunit HisH, partial [Bacteroidia bacterium]|nr:imidazole glycerol phosphate synthase subunit HisH [Bacteroidia bacterium]